MAREAAVGWIMFDVDQFIFDCKDALRQDHSPSSVREVVARAVGGPAAVLKALGEPQKAEIQTLYRADNLTILNVIWAPWMTVLPHNHQMWAVIGIYAGREDNVLWHRETGRMLAPGFLTLSEAPQCSWRVLACCLATNSNRSNVAESAQMPEGNKIGDENTFCDSPASVQTSNLAFTMPLLSSYERRATPAEVQNWARWNKDVNGELPQVLFRNSE
jgi:hypothetical protein